VKKLSEVTMLQDKGSVGFALSLVLWQPNEEAKTKTTNDETHESQTYTRWRGSGSSVEQRILIVLIFALTVGSTALYIAARGINDSKENVNFWWS
jgi:hypothetical protein